MTISATEKIEIEAIIQAITDATATRKRRKLADMFLSLPDADAWPEYYEVHIFC
jgi:chromatin structure-remodeling complex subunit RSC1/2